MNTDLSDKGWQELQARLEQLHSKYFGDEMHKVEFMPPGGEDLSGMPAEHREDMQ